MCVCMCKNIECAGKIPEEFTDGEEEVDGDMEKAAEDIKSARERGEMEVKEGGKKGDGGLEESGEKKGAEEGVAEFNVAEVELRRKTQILKKEVR